MPETKITAMSLIQRSRTRIPAVFIVKFQGVIHMTFELYTYVYGSISFGILVGQHSEMQSDRTKMKMKMAASTAQKT
jgi:hypothetical protein